MQIITSITLYFSYFLLFNWIIKVTTMMSEVCVVDKTTPAIGWVKKDTKLMKTFTPQEQQRLQCQMVMSAFKQSKLEKEAQKNWDKFYKRNGDRFFKVCF